jgi:hypothetical protein
MQFWFKKWNKNWEKVIKRVKIENIGKFIKFERSSTIWFGKIKLEMIVQVEKKTNN